jgi:hypothetical protein
MAVRARTIATIAVAVILIGAGIVVLRQALSPTSPPVYAIAVPAIGEVNAAFLADGRPVFVARHRDGSISVLDAFSTHVPTIYKLLAWCPEARVFTDVFHGATYDESGIAIRGPAPTSMLELAWQYVSPGSLRVTGTARPAGPRAPDDGGQIDLSTCHYLMHRFDAAQALTPAEAGTLPGGRWVLVFGSLDVAQQRLCGAGVGCPGPVNAEGLQNAPQQPEERSWSEDDQLWLVLTTGGGVDHLTVMIPEIPPFVSAVTAVLVVAR